jgi:hypothetical protein
MKQRIANKIFYYSLKSISAAPLQKLYEAFYKLLDLLEDKTNSLVTYHFRPAKADMFATATESYADKNIAIILQGPVVAEYDFTLETIRIYKKLFPGCRIILSTWEDEKPKLIERAKAEGIDVVLNKKPEYFGVQNINLQVVSTKGGLDMAKKYNAAYILKTRTDQRIYDKDALSLFFSMMENFPVGGGVNQKKRLIATNLITLKYRYYGLSDMLMFGDAQDMAAYWNVPLDMRKDIVNAKKTYSIGEHAKFRLGEMYFLTQFLEMQGEKLKWTLEHTWQVYKDRFCIIDFNMVGLYWLKYNKRDDNKYNFYAAGNTLQKLSFADWLNIYNGVVREYPEHVLELAMGEDF